MRVATLCPGSVATPWWMERERGGKETPATPEMLATMLSAEACATACMAIVDQVGVGDRNGGRQRCAER